MTKKQTKRPQGRTVEHLPIVKVKPSTYQPSRKELREDVTLQVDPREVLRAVLRPVKIQFEEQSHEMQKVGKIELTELPWNKAD